jgi:hypothetical protein
MRQEVGEGFGTIEESGKLIRASGRTKQYTGSGKRYQNF